MLYYYFVNSNECVVFYYWCFNHGFKYQNSFCNGCHDLTMLCRNLSDIGVIPVTGVYYCCINYDIIKSDTLLLSEKSVLHDRGYI